MHGTNIVRDFIAAPTAERLQVRQIFPTIQGEGPFIGHPAVFVRLTGCNLRCWFCDTTWDDEQDQHMTYDEIADSVTRVITPGRLVVITGGEPLLQPVGPLVERLVQRAMLVQFETAGSVFREELVAGVSFGRMVQFVVSPKTPKVHSRWLHMRHGTHWKYPLRTGHVSPVDGLPTTSTQRKDFHASAQRPPDWLPRKDVYVTPVDETGDGDWQKNVPAVVQSAMKFGYTAQVQLHKVIGVE